MIELQRKLLGDAVRNKAFAEAIRRTVKKKDRVIDLGSGTGFLGFLASRLGAGHVTFIESGDILAVSRSLAKRNGIRNCTFLHVHSTDVKQLPKTNVLISETLGNYALEENIIETIEDAKRFLKPKGIIIPGKIRQCVCPVVRDRLMKEIDVWPTVGFDLDFTEAREVCLNNMYVKRIKPGDLNGQWTMNNGQSAAIRQWDCIDFSQKEPLQNSDSTKRRAKRARRARKARKAKRLCPSCPLCPFFGAVDEAACIFQRFQNKSIRTATIGWKPEKPLTIHGFALWWEAELVPGVTLSTSPFAPPTHWEQIFLPLLRPVHLKDREQLELTLVSDTRLSVKINLTWNVRHLSTSGKVLSEQRMDMRRGYVA